MKASADFSEWCHEIPVARPCPGAVQFNLLAADASERKFIREGMSEAEVLLQIGKPDSESIDSGGAAAVEKR
ncbi:MAG: hypothetical protein U1F55_07190 [Chitinivorax sp.]